MSATPKRSRSGRDSTRLILVDAFPVYGEALGSAIAMADDLVYLGLATDPAEAVELVTQHLPDVAIVDLDLPIPDKPELDGIDVTRQIKDARRETRVLILSAKMEVDTLARAALEGACGFLSKASTLEEIRHAVRTAKDGGMFVEQELISPLLARLHQGRPIGGGSRRTKLTPREHDVLGLLGEGLDVTTIARRLEITVNTARGHVKSILSKLGCHSQLEAVVEATHQGLLPQVSH